MTLDELEEQIARVKERGAKGDTPIMVYAERRSRGRSKRLTRAGNRMTGMLLCRLTEEDGSEELFIRITAYAPKP